MTDTTRTAKPPKRPESVLVLVYTRAGEVLMLRRRFPEGFWQSVTGSLEWGEAATAAAKRELAEETGLMATDVEDCLERNTYDIYPFFLHRYAPGTTTNDEHIFRLQLDGPVPIRIDPAEHEEFRWVPREQAAAMAVSHTNRDAILRWVPKP